MMECVGLVSTIVIAVIYLLNIVPMKAGVLYLEIWNVRQMKLITHTQIMLILVTQLVVKKGNYLTFVSVDFVEDA